MAKRLDVRKSSTPKCRAPHSPLKPINEDEDLSSVAVQNTATGADGKSYDMLCLPEKYIYGWLFTINPKKVASDAKESVSLYRRQCYDALYKMFFSNPGCHVNQLSSI